MSPADLDLARELRVRLPETIYDLSESWVIEGDCRRMVRGRLGGMRLVFLPRHQSQWVPDLHDPTGATAGVLLAMLQERISADVSTRTGHGGTHGAMVEWMGQRFAGSTLAVAAARALLAVGGPR